MIEKIRSQFIERFGNNPLIVTSPGRVNLIGEHTDYNQGFVLPAAIDKKIAVAIAKNNEQVVNVYAAEYNELFSFPLTDIKPASDWKNYILGVTNFTQQQTGMLPSGLDLVIDGDVPVGSGMSSSAALCCAYGFALNELFSLGMSRMDIAFNGQKTEHNFVGVKSGLMDQFASLHGKKGYLMKLDCRSLEYEYIPFDFPSYKIVLVNSMVHHSLASSEYNVRRQQCEEGVAILKKHFPEIVSLRDVSAAQLEEHKNELPAIVYQRCKYVAEENDRLLKGCDAMKAHDLETFGKLMYRTHEGLSKEYEVSCPELDFLVEQAKKIDSVAGSRMMGGGFGGCTINIVESDGVNEFVEFIQDAYQKQYDKTPDVYITQIEDGAKVIEY